MRADEHAGTQASDGASHVAGWPSGATPVNALQPTSDGSEGKEGPPGPSAGPTFRLRTILGRFLATGACRRGHPLANGARCLACQGERKRIDRAQRRAARLNAALHCLRRWRISAKGVGLKERELLDGYSPRAIASACLLGAVTGLSCVTAWCPGAVATAVRFLCGGAL